MQAFELLIKDHRKVADLFSQAEEAQGEKQKQRLYKQISEELELHTEIEETILYPALRQHDEFTDHVLEALEEHKQVKTLIREIAQLTDGSEKFEAKLKVMQENVEHHVEEEETELFPRAQSILSADELTQLENQIALAKKQSSPKAGKHSTAR